MTARRHHSFLCDQSGCGNRTEVRDADSLDFAQHTATMRGWTFTFAGAGHGWLSHCPRHRPHALRIDQGAAA